MSQSSPPESRKLLLLVSGILCLCLLCCGGIVWVRGQTFRVEGLAMEPNVHDGQYILVLGLPYLLQKPQRGDVIVFQYPLDPRKNFIKRVIGLPNEHVQIRDKQVWINDQVLSETTGYSQPEYEWGPELDFIQSESAIGVRQG